MLERDQLRDQMYLAVISTLVVHTGPSVSAGVGEAFVHLLLTVTAHITSLTSTLVCVVFVLTRSCVLTDHVHRHTWSTSKLSLRILFCFVFFFFFLANSHFKTVIVKLVSLTNIRPLFNVSPLMIATAWQDMLGMSQ